MSNLGQICVTSFLKLSLWENLSYIIYLLSKTVLAKFSISSSLFFNNLSLEVDIFPSFNVTLDVASKMCWVILDKFFREDSRGDANVPLNVMKTTNTKISCSRILFWQLVTVILLVGFYVCLYTKWWSSKQLKINENPKFKA